MSTLSIGAGANVLPKVTFQLHGRHRGAQAAAEQAGAALAGAEQPLAGSVGQLPIGAAQNLRAGAAQTLQQALGAQPPATGGRVNTRA